MTDKNLTEIICVVDRSGSMSSCWDDAVGGFDTFVKDQKEAGIGECKFTLVTFDTRYDVVYDAEPIENVKSLKELCAPRGGTALFDAIGTAIATVGMRLNKTPEEKRPGNVIMVILTDGAENSSREYGHVTVKDMIEHQTNKYGWQFMFLAQNIDAAAHGGNIGLSMSNHAHFVASPTAGGMGAQAAYKVASAVAVGTRSKGARGMQVNCTKPEKDQYARFASCSSVQDWGVTSEALDDDIKKFKQEYENYRNSQSEESDTSGTSK